MQSQKKRLYDEAAERVSEQIGSEGDTMSKVEFHKLVVQERIATSLEHLAMKAK